MRGNPSSIWAAESRALCKLEKRQWWPSAFDVGKRPGETGIQDRIHGLLVEHGRKTRTDGAPVTVVRLKGGDPFVFGRGSEEVAALRAVKGVSQVTNALSNSFGRVLSALPRQEAELAVRFAW